MNRFLANAEVSLIDSLSITAICVLIVFIMLILLALVVASFQLFSGKKQEEPVQEVEQPVTYTQPSSLKLEDIKDEDMMVAALVATIDYHEETQQDVRVVSIKQIG